MLPQRPKPPLAQSVALKGICWYEANPAPRGIPCYHKHSADAGPAFDATFCTMAPSGEELEKQAAALRESNPGNRAAK